jgi:hypothetical protein
MPPVSRARTLRLVLGLCLVSSAGVLAQEDDTQEDFEDPELEAALAPAPEPSQAEVQQTVSPPAPRARLFVVAMEAGLNGLSGTGVNVFFHASPAVALDLGVGYSAVGVKAGLRVRYKFLRGAFKPFTALGYSYGNGTGATEHDVREAWQATRYQVLPSHYAQVTGGLEYLAPQGFDLLFAAGYSFLLNSNIRTLLGPINNEQLATLSTQYGSGIALSASIGFGF